MADSWGPITQREFRSENGKHLLKIEPRKGSDKPGHCHATLFRIAGKERTELWSRFLINNHAPVRVFVSNTGDFVLTMDEWHSVGELPVVIYGQRGGLVRVHSTDSLGLKDDDKHIAQTVSSYWWNAGSMSFFGPKDETFFIHLHWGKLLLIDLDDGDLMDDEWYSVAKEWQMSETKWNSLHGYANAEIEKRALRWLESEEADERKIGAVLCGRRNLKDAIPGLKKLLTDQAHFMAIGTDHSTRLYYVRRAAKQALEELGEDAGDVVLTARE